MRIRHLRLESVRPLISPSILIEELPLSERGSDAVTRARDDLIRILDGKDDRLIAVVGPSLTHHTAAALDYGRRLKSLADELAQDLCVVMRVYLEEPRLPGAWKGLI